MAPLLRMLHHFLHHQLRAGVYTFLVSSRKAAELKDRVARSVEEAVKTAASAPSNRCGSSSSSSFSSGKKASESGGEARPFFLSDGTESRRASGTGFFASLKKRLLS
ncbi:hypothetical protein BESB_072630 [Besnoitia besnoiti]|uniref:Uncharacterized protein n=1 Tax=Besnoitia besnoiti TaxID=94643 RepID=A0A2A9MCS5_BESBE|nr:uncharacterized protein BESB_072630 [Besnoitia besnoiti]PFH34111.1 hypothetical protein BESB_072630 [Besnoitia besnoiti]